MSISTDQRPDARILVVDDDERNLLALSEVLSSIASVETASSGRDALRLLLNRDYAVILLDVFMPGMDGYETAAFIREREQTARVPIIFLSAVNKETEHLLRGYEMGAVDYVFKPVDPTMLKSKVGVFVDLYRMRRRVEEQARAEQALREVNYHEQLERLRIERDLQESERRQTAILESLPIVLYLEEPDADPRVPDFVGGSFTSVTGFRFEDLKTNPHLWMERLHPDDRDRALKALANRRQSGAMAIEYRWQCADGQYKHFLDQAVFLKRDDGSGHFAGTLLDITERKQLEARLVHAGKIDALGQLTGGVAHDFNNLLAAVLGGLDILQRRIVLPDREKAVVKQMRHAAEHGADLVRRMMAFARQQELTPTSVDPQLLCQSVAGLVSHTLGGKTTIDWRCENSRLNLFIDRAQLELAMVNLILNARDAMPDGGRIEVVVEPCEPVEEPRSQLPPRIRICVRDHGQGIAPHHLAKITEPFFTTKPAGRGTGLGLSMVAGFVQQSGGELKVDSRVGSGTTIELILPATLASSAGMEPVAASRAKALFDGKRLLLIDDDDAVRVVLREQLSDLGMRIDDFSSGTAAIAALVDDPARYDFVLSDFAMPGIDGIETLRQVQAIIPRAMIALMTGYADERMIEVTKADIPLVRKPLDIESLAKVLEACRDPA